jgi:catechol 2,3-dioxygenase
MTHLIRQLGYLVLETPDLAASVAEATQLMGLRLAQRQPEQAVLTSNTRRGELAYVSGERAAVRSVGLEAESEAAVVEAQWRVRKAGCEILSTTPVAPGAACGFVFRTPYAHCFEVHSQVPRDQPAHYPTSGIRPQRMDHVQLMAEDAQGLGRLLIDALGMQLSDSSDDGSFVFLRAADLCHHTIAVIQGPARLHHVSFEAAQQTDLMRVGDMLKRRGRGLVWGPGHHGANAQSYFTYHRDIAGFIMEYSYGMTHIEDEALYTPGVWPARPAPGQDWLNEWGAPPPNLFTEGGVPVAVPELAAERA